MAVANPLRGQSGKIGLVEGNSTTFDFLSTKPGGAVTTEVYNITSFELTQGQDLIDVSALGDDARRFKTGLQSWSVRLSGQWVASDTGSNQDEVQESIMRDFGGTLADSTDHTIGGHFYVDGESATKLAYYGLMIVEESTVRVPVDGIVEFDVSARGHGRLGYIAV